MALSVLIGGARAGKSSLAAKLASAAGAPVTFVATAEGLDDDMRNRIARHRIDRPKEWDTIEEPLDLERALSEVDPAHAIIVDCLTLWVTNLLLKGLSDEEIEERAASASAIAAARAAPTVVVTNEVGSGVVPDTDLGRRYRDLLGRVNVIWAGVASEAFLVVAGRSIRLESPEPR